MAKKKQDSGGSNQGSGSSRRSRRQEEMARQQRQQQLRLWVPVAVVIVALVGFTIYRLLEPNLEGVVDYGPQARDHDVSVVFEETDLPPVGGVHHPTWQNCGIYDSPVTVSNAVHSLEHGAVWIAYQPELPASDVQTLQEMARGKALILLSPYPNLRSPVVLSAWGLQLELDGVDVDKIDSFINRYRGQGPEPGAACTGGVGTPIQ